MGKTGKIRKIAAVMIMHGAVVFCGTGTAWAADTNTKIEWRGEKAEVKSSVLKNGYKGYSLKSTVFARGTLERNKNFDEKEGQLIIRTGNEMFDALFALALDESRQNSVSEITDGSFNGGRPIKIDAFQTGREWTYVWTRDTAYSAALSLGYVDPGRAMNSLLFKISGKREKTGAGIMSGIEIVQDTGSGGSWPISTDRVVWAMGAWETLKYLDGAEREKFFSAAYEAVINTIENDRTAIYDISDGLYRGEQSFLDWREQTYPLWTRNETQAIGMSKTLSTNAAHYAILDIASKMAEMKGDKSSSEKYRQWADNLKEAVNREFWLEDKGLYSSMKLSGADSGAVYKYEALGESLAVLTGIAGNEKAVSVVEKYPNCESGPATIWPQLMGTPPYHNRSVWPFVTAFYTKAAAKVSNTAVFEHNILSMVRQSALNLSNMENYELLSGRHSYIDRYNGRGPVINSQRQLWSVAGYISMIVDGIFGMESTWDGIRFAPFVTTKLRNEFFKSSGAIELKNFSYLGNKLNLKVVFPKNKESADGYYGIESVKLNGQAVGAGWITKAMMKGKNDVVITLGKAIKQKSSINIEDAKDYKNISDGEYRKIFAPVEPRIDAEAEDGGKAKLTINVNSTDNLKFNIFKNGRLYKAGIKEEEWSDTATPAAEKEILRYGINNGLAYNNGTISENGGVKYLAKWGEAADEITIGEIKPRKTAEYWLKTLYSNSHNTVNTGITACVKLVEITEKESGKRAAQGIITMPHLGAWGKWGNSTLLSVKLEAGKAYTAVIKDFYNMSYFDHFSTYNGAGGKGGAVNTADIAEVTLETGVDYYTVEAEYTDSGNKSHRSKPAAVK